MGLFYVFCTLFLTVYGQLIIKWQILKVGMLPLGVFPKVIFYSKLFANPWILSAFLAAFLAALAWMAAMTKLQLSYAYPFMSLSFVLVLFLSILFFHETFSWYKMLGMTLIVLGLYVSSHA